MGRSLGDEPLTLMRCHSLQGDYILLYLLEIEKCMDHIVSIFLIPTHRDNIYYLPNYEVKFLIKINVFLGV